MILSMRIYPICKQSVLGHYLFGTSRVFYVDRAGLGLCFPFRYYDHEKVLVHILLPSDSMRGALGPIKSLQLGGTRIGRKRSATRLHKT